LVGYFWLDTITKPTEQSSIAVGVASVIGSLLFLYFEFGFEEFFIF
jgi:hypothetical protein